MAQTIEEFVGKTLDVAPITKTHIQVIALIAAGYFFDILDLIVLGALIPDMVQTKFATAAEAGLIGSATLVGLFIGSFGQGQFTDRMGRKTVYQFNLLLFGVATIAGAFAPNIYWLAGLRFIAGIGLGAEQPLCFAYAGEYSPKRIRGRILAIIHFIGGACVWPIAFLFPLLFRDALGWRGIWIVIGIGALVVFVFRFTLPESPRWLATHGKGDKALDILKSMGLPGPSEPLTTGAASDTKTDPFMVVFRQFPGRVIAGMICFSAFFGVAIGLGTWLPNMMSSQGFTVTKSLTYTFGMTLAVPCASIFMMYALDNIGRKKTSVVAFICAGIMAIVFANARSDTQLLIAGFIMIFCYQVAGNAMQIFASEVFPTNARASGFGMAAGVGRLMTAWILPTILWIQTGYGLTAVFACIAVVLLVAAYSVTKLGPEFEAKGTRRGRGADWVIGCQQGSTGTMANAGGARGMIAVDKMGTKVLFLDPATYETEVVLDDFPRTVHELLVVPETGLAYVPIFGDGIHGRNPNPGHLLCIIDLERRAHVGDIDLRPYIAPHTLKLAPDGLVYITCENSAVVAVIDRSTHKVVDAIDSGSTNGHRLIISPDGRRLYTENEEDGTVSVIDLPKRKLLRKIDTPRALAGIAISADGRTVVAVDDEQPTLFLIDTESERVAHTVRLEGVPEAAQIARYSPDNSMIGVTSLKSDTVSLIDPSFRRQTAIKVGSQPMDMAFRGDELFVACQGDGSVHIVDIPAQRVKHSFHAGTGCESLGFF